MLYILLSNCCDNGCLSARGPSTPAGSMKKQKEQDEADDLTKDMEEPPSDTNIQEVTSKLGPSSKKDHEQQPIKGMNFFFLHFSH